MSFDKKNDFQQRMFKPIQLVKMPYRHWIEKRRFTQELQDLQRETAEATNHQMLHFHEELWSHWPDIAQNVRQDVRREENNTHE